MVCRGSPDALRDTSSTVLKFDLLGGPTIRWYSVVCAAHRPPGFGSDSCILLQKNLDSDSAQITFGPAIRPERGCSLVSLKNSRKRH